jgi:hypothetical protein
MIVADYSAALASAVSGLSRSEARIVGYAYDWTCGASVLTPCKRLSWTVDWLVHSTSLWDALV